MKIKFDGPSLRTQAQMITAGITLSPVAIVAGATLIPGTVALGAFIFCSVAFFSGILISIVYDLVLHELKDHDQNKDLPTVI
jgi:hypothetical protein